MLTASIRSVLGSKGTDIDVVIVANACTEPIPPWIESSNQIHVLSTEKSMGFAAANNWAVEWHSGEMGGADAYFFLNNDAVVEPDTIAKLYSVLAEDSQCGAVGPEIRIWGAPDYLNSLGLNVTEFCEAWDEGIGRPASEFVDRVDEAEVLALTGAALMVRAESFREVGGWPGIYRYYFEDIDLCLRLRAQGWTVKNFRLARVMHAVSATSGGFSDMKRYFSWRNQFLVLAIHWPWPLLLRVGPRLAAVQLGVFVRRLKVKAYPDARLQAKAWFGALLQLPAVLRERWRVSGDHSWTRFLLHSGTVPVIELPRARDKPWHNGGDILGGDQPKVRDAPVEEGIE